MTSGFAKEYQPNPANAAKYAEIYQKYLRLGKVTEEEQF